MNENVHIAERLWFRLEIIASLGINLIGLSLAALFAPKDQALRATMRAGVTLCWRNLFTRFENFAISMKEAGALYAAAVEQGDRDKAQMLINLVERHRESIPQAS